MLGLYIHIPYCASKCYYCDFYSAAAPGGVPEAYIDALLRELARFSNCDTGPLRPDTVYFGGGTPSLLAPAQVRRILAAVAPAPGAEVTLEANPETVTPGGLPGGGSEPAELRGANSFRRQPGPAGTPPHRRPGPPGPGLGPAGRVRESVRRCDAGPAGLLHR